MVCLMTVSIAQIIQRRKRRRSANEESKRAWKETVVAYFKVQSGNLPEETKENQENLRIVRLRAQIWNQDLPNTKQEC